MIILAGIMPFSSTAQQYARTGGDQFNPQSMNVKSRIEKFQIRSEKTQVFWLDSIRYFSFDQMALSWDLMYKRSHVYDPVGNLTEEMEFFYNPVSMQYENSYRYLMVYSPNNFLVQSTAQYWNSVTLDWENDYRTLFTNNSSGVVTEYVYQYWNGLQWVSSYKEELAVNSMNQWTEITGFYWNDISNAWINDYKAEISYTSFNEWNIVLVYYWDDIFSIWDLNTRITYTYNSINLLVQSLYEMFVGGTWQNDYKSEYTYNTNNKEILGISQYWDIMNNVWVLSSRVQTSWNAEGNMSEIVYSYHNQIEWVPSWKDEHFYKNVTGVPHHQDISLNVYPNPVTDELNLNFDESMFGKAMIYSLTGKLLYDTDFSGQSVTIPVYSLPGGMYVLKVQTDNQNVFSSKFFKQ